MDERVDRPVVYLHVGLPKTGTTALQTLMAENRDALRAQGVLYPFLHRGAMFHAAVEVLDWSERWGIAAEEVRGTWAALCDRVRGHHGPSVISHEVLGRATRKRVEWAMAELEGVEVHVVLTARDLARQVTAVWQERIKNGKKFDFARFCEYEGVAATGRRRALDNFFWKEQDLAFVARKWGDHVPPERVHVVTVPPPGGDRDELVRRFGGVIGADLTGLRSSGGANTSLGSPAVGLLRRVNTLLDDRLEGPAYFDLVKYRFAQQLLPQLPGERAQAPAYLREPFEEATRGWRREIERRGWRVHGDLDDLRPTDFSTGTREPGDVDAEDLVAGAPALIADLLVDLAAQRPARH